MAVLADERYDATVIGAALTESKTKKTPSLWFKFKTDDGTIEHEMWLTPNTIDRAAKTMDECFAISRKQMADLAFFEDLGERLRDWEVSITTEAESYTDKEGRPQTKVVVKWLNPRGMRREPASLATKAVAARLFGGGPVSAPRGAQKAAVADGWPTDDDVPF